MKSIIASIIAYLPVHIPLSYSGLYSHAISPLHFLDYMGYIYIWVIYGDIWIYDELCTYMYIYIYIKSLTKWDAHRSNSILAGKTKKKKNMFSPQAPGAQEELRAARSMAPGTKYVMVYLWMAIDKLYIYILQ